MHLTHISAQFSKIHVGHFTNFVNKFRKSEWTCRITKRGNLQWTMLRAETTPHHLPVRNSQNSELGFASAAFRLLIFSARMRDLGSDWEERRLGATNYRFHTSQSPGSLVCCVRRDVQEQANKSGEKRLRSRRKPALQACFLCLCALRGKRRVWPW